MKVVRKGPGSGDRDAHVRDLLPSVMTCNNYFKLPDYGDKALLKDRLLFAITEGQGAFTLT